LTGDADPAARADAEAKKAAAATRVSLGAIERLAPLEGA
jgi:hypothetical protein